MGYKKLLFKIGILLTIVFGAVEIFYWFNPFKKQEIEYNYNASIIEKHSRLKSLPSPKIVLIAGSSFAYGLNSSEIEKSMKKPVVNMAVHFDFGTNFMLKQIENELHEGDIVVMGFEYMITSEGNTNEKYIMSKFYPEAKNWFNYYHFPDCIAEPIKIRISSLRINSVKMLNSENAQPSVDDSTSIFFRRATNQYGDLIAHLNNPSVKELPLSTVDKYTDLEKPLADMNAFTEKMKKKGVKVFFVFPPLAESSYKKDKEFLAKFDKQFQHQAKFKVLGHPEDFIYADSLCQDSPFHLNAVGREIHTRKLITLLQNSNN